MRVLLDVSKSYRGISAVTASSMIDSRVAARVKIPFACAHAPDPEAVRSRWLIGAVVLNLFAFHAADLQLLALGSLRGTLIFVAVMLAAIAIIRAAGRQEARRLTVDLDGPDEMTMQTLKLSEALN